jgi:hypothetical protein
MESGSAAVRAARNSIMKHGFYIAQDPTFGRLMQQMADDAVPLASAGGLQCFRTTILDHEVGLTSLVLNKTFTYPTANPIDHRIVL